MTTDGHRLIQPPNRSDMHLRVDHAAAYPAVLLIGGEKFTAICPPTSQWVHIAPYLEPNGAILLPRRPGLAGGIVQGASRFLAACLDEDGVSAVRMQYEAGTWRADDPLKLTRLLMNMWWDNVTMTDAP